MQSYATCAARGARQASVQISIISGYAALSISAGRVFVGKRHTKHIIYVSRRSVESVLRSHNITGWIVMTVRRRYLRFCDRDCVSLVVSLSLSVCL